MKETCQAQTRDLGRERGERERERGHCYDFQSLAWDMVLDLGASSSQKYFGDSFDEEWLGGLPAGGKSHGERRSPHLIFCAMQIRIISGTRLLQLGYGISNALSQ